jgi:hypothetical protein
MRALLTIVAVAATFTATTSQAQTGGNAIPYYPWCAVDTTVAESLRRSCGFTTYAQCMESVRGQTGTCFENTWGPKPTGVVPDERPARRR